MDDYSFCGHADLATLLWVRYLTGNFVGKTYMEECTKGTGVSGFLDIGILKDNAWCLASEFHKDWLEILPSGRGDDGSHMCTACEIDFLDSRVLDYCCSHLNRILGVMSDYVEAAIWKTGFFEDFSDGPKASWRELGAFQDCSVTSS